MTQSKTVLANWLVGALGAALIFSGAWSYPMLAAMGVALIGIGLAMAVASGDEANLMAYLAAFAVVLFVAPLFLPIDCFPAV